MATLLLRLAAPLQSWGDESKFEYRRTLTYPTKSGVVGMLAAALGRSREESVADLAALKFGVRVDREGELLEDFHIARNGKTSYITHRHYLCDAIFLAGFEGDGEFLAELAAALKAPAFPLYLGRRSCPPTLPIVLGIEDAELEAALENEAWLVPDKEQKRADGVLRIITDSDDPRDAVLRDVPVSYSKSYRKYGLRYAKDYIIEKSAQTSHDAMSELE